MKLGILFGGLVVGVLALMFLLIFLLLWAWAGSIDAAWEILRTKGVQ